jgi:hypothetical protein
MLPYPVLYVEMPKDIVKCVPYSCQYLCTAAMAVKAVCKHCSCFYFLDTYCDLDKESCPIPGEELVFLIVVSKWICILLRYAEFQKPHLEDMYTLI